MRCATIGFLLLSVVIIGTIENPNVWAQDQDWFDQHTTFWEGKAKIGGQLRLRWESLSDFDFDDGVSTDNKDDDFLLSRVRLSLDVKPVEELRLYLQLQDSHHFEPDVHTAPVFRSRPSAREDRIDIFQAFVDANPFSEVPLTVRAGRHEMNYGTQRLIGGFGWSNVGRSFQGVKAMYDGEDFFVDAFGVDVVIPEDNHFNNADTRDDFYGVYGGWKKFPTGVLEGYVLFRDLRDSHRRDREVYTIGTRLVGHLGKAKAIDYSAELALQTGDFEAEDSSEDLDQEAFAAHVGMGYTFKDQSARPRLAVEYNFSTGDDDPNDGDHETLDSLFPTNHLHYGYMDLFSWRNIHNVRLNASAKPTEKLAVKCDLHFFWLDEENDAWYNAGGGVVRQDETGDPDRYVGEELDLTATYKVNKHLSFMAGYSHFFAEDFVSDTGESDDADWVYLQTAFAF